MKKYFAWTIFVFNSLVILFRFSVSIRGIGATPVSPAEAAGFFVLTLVFSLMGALIVVRTEGNRIGWLMLLLGFVLADPFRTYLEYAYPALQGAPTTAIYFAFWTQGWLFFVILYAVFLILLQFPTGRPLTLRWNRVRLISLFTFAQFILVYTFQPRFGDGEFFIDNPIVLLALPASDTISGLFFGLGLILLAVSSVSSLFVRYRRAGAVVRAQIRWLLYASVIAFSAIWYLLLTYDPGVQDGTENLLSAALLIIAVAIAIAILRYRLYDIDIIIRRTLQYTLLTGVLAVLFFGGVVLLQGLFQGLTGNADSPLVTVISTLLIAALFNPLRIRTQDWIDRRFYRAKYDAEKALADFARTARDEVDMARLSDQLVGLVAETMKPTKVRLLLTTTRREKDV